MCAAPGGKRRISLKMNDQGEVFAHDIHDHKIKLIEANAERLGLSSIQAKSGDSRKLDTVYEHASFDRILVDAPCSGLGVIRRKPEIKYVKTAEDFKGLIKLQLALLETAKTLIKDDGLIIYSTCTVEYDENRGMIDTFLRKHEDMTLVPLSNLEGYEKLAITDHTLQVLPQHFGGDGFFVAALKKKD